MPVDGLLTFEDGLVTLGKELLPGILVGQSIRGAVRYDESSSDQMSGKKKVAMGWEDATITLTLDLLCDNEGDCYKKLTIINRIFKAAAKDKTAPQIYTVTGAHMRARGIGRVVFDALESGETDCEDTIQVTLTFTEHLPAVVKREKQANAKKKGNATSTQVPAVKAKPAAAPAIVKDDTGSFMAGFNAGNN